MNDKPAKNPFEMIGEAQARSREKKQHEQKSHERRVSSEKYQKEERDEQTQFKLYRKAHRTALTALLTNPIIGDKVSALVKYLKTLGPESAPALVDYIERSEWLLRANKDVRQECLSIIADAIVRVRVQCGLPPFDDSLLDEPPTAFEVIRKMLVGV